MLVGTVLYATMSLCFGKTVLKNQFASSCIWAFFDAAQCILQM